MKSDAVYEGLKDLAQRLGITVTEQNFRRMGVRAKGGFCIVKGKPMFFIDKKSPLADKIEMLSAHLSTLPTDHIYLVPALRRHLQGTGKGTETLIPDETGDASKS